MYYYICVVSIYICIHIHIHVYTRNEFGCYIDSSRSRCIRSGCSNSGGGGISGSSLHVYIYTYIHVCVYIYIYGYVHMYMCVYIYVYMCVRVSTTRVAPTNRPDHRDIHDYDRPKVNGMVPGLYRTPDPTPES